MGFNELRDRGACHMAECLRTNRSLLTVRLNNCAITDSGVRRLSGQSAKPNPKAWVAPPATRLRTGHMRKLVRGSRRGQQVDRTGPL